VSPARKRKRKDSTTTRPTTITTKSARAHAKSYRPGPPIVPRMIINRLLDYVSKVPINKRQLFIERLCRYWSLKREARRGAPLLKRLHLEPWTATTESRDETEAEKAKKLEFLVALRNDLEKVRLLAELVRKREKEKLRQAQVIKDLVEGFVFPHYMAIRSAYDRIAALDREDIFLHPVDKEEVPDYYEVVKEPICFSEIDEKIENVKYRNVAEFKVSSSHARYKLTSARHQSRVRERAAVQQVGHGILPPRRAVQGDGGADPRRA
jgi:NuA3 HAT complex component NTO1